MPAFKGLTANGKFGKSISPVLRNKEGEEYDYHRLESILTQNTLNKPAEIVNNIEETLLSFKGDKELDDDYTLVAIKFYKKP